MSPIQTVAEVQAQALGVPETFDDTTWRRFAASIDGYAIAQELGFDLIGWGVQQEQAYKQSGVWNLDVLALRLMLFYEFRADYMSGYTYHERDDLVDSLLAALSEATGQAYQRLYPVK